MISGLQSDFKRRLAPIPVEFLVEFWWLIFAAFDVAEYYCPRGIAILCIFMGPYHILFNRTFHDRTLRDLVRPAWTLRPQTHAHVFLSSIKLEEFHGHVYLMLTLLFRRSSF